MNVEATAQRPESPRYRQVAIGQPSVTITPGTHGEFYLRADEPLQPYPEHLLDRLLHWAELKPDATLVAQRGSDGQWQRISYRQMLVNVRALAQSLLGYGLSAERPLVILSGNDLEHLQLAFAAMYAGIPYCPVSPAYALLSQDLAKLRHIFEVLQPGLIFATDAAPFQRAIEALSPVETPLVFTRGELPGRVCERFTSLLQQSDCTLADLAFAGTNADSIAKFLFTSGSTKLPKAVPTTQRMLCANQQMLLQTFPEFAVEPPVLVDWLPWNHTFGGSHNVGIVLYNGGSLYIDGGKPTPQGMAETLRNLKEIAPTAYLTVPKGWEELVGALECDAELRDNFFSRIKLLFFAAAGLSQSVWDRLDRVAEQHCGERIRMMAGLGMTEASPSCTFTTGPLSMAGYVGLPAPGCEVKLVPVEGKLEGRFRGPHIMTGYWRSWQQTLDAFDEEGFYRSGDALKFADPEQPQLGLMFDGRIAEDFKLSTGVFVSVGPLRTRVILQGAPYVQDVVVTGPDRQRLGLLLFPYLPACRELAGLEGDADVGEVLAAAPVRHWLAGLLAELNRDATGLASRIAWLCPMSEAPSLDAGEVTDKGSLNQRAVLTRRADLIDALYAAPGASGAVVEEGA
ncbi:feruloyl-CoA synthase [Pseudomonas aeruginosa]|uniref:feruloyl-CoA synthase n=1 Tax=Pseudomonas aeruginosa TaxID=287 RepID=UPI00053E0453|nr:feruloyl-CoA synthase [Pseudomonas aeruginosa]MCO2031490.1 feruloyl-CoA synthase [Pseudomonas aeruginosa]MCS7675725.1 feruloyl-CoA synthase [Pseudomonas aeruginosa]MCS7905032.1 feruloyl-CoA synthase [Pseudomonas aeruginosa]MCS9345795.1 feruloyl-CoA synthase [Pseudomonas aeruginosa]MCS9358634.1 feruloyl-CoA synthase [Pseudomonas aeruginosa]